MQRVGQIIRLKPGAYEEYKRLHAEAWPGVLDAISRAGVRNFSIYHWNGFLFACLEYVGDDLEADLALLTADPVMRDWWRLTDALQEPVQGHSSGSVEGNWWTPMEELFHME